MQLTGKNIALETIYENPLDRFVTGFLFPICEVEENTDDDLEVAPESLDSEPNEATTITVRKRYIPPSSVGLSFFISGESIQLRVFYNAVFYQKQKDDLSRNEQGRFVNTWKRKPLTDDNGEEVIFTPNGLKQYDILEYHREFKGRVEVLWRSYADGYIVTVTILNTQNLPDFNDAKEYVRNRNEKTLFNVELACIVETGDLSVYPSKDKALLSEEEQEIELRYKDKHIYAVGHGAAANWKKNEAGKWELFIDFMPEVEVPQVTADTAGEDRDALNFHYLSREKKQRVIQKLTQFIQNYDGWISKQEQQAAIEAAEDRDTAAHLIKKQKTALKRMQEGIQHLESDEYIWQAFITMNHAMLMQWKAGNPEFDHKNLAWRPFQLAFILMTLESVINNDSEYRDTVDLIWFPTGGGKTEAYLGLMAFLFLYRRMKYPASSGGTIAIMRYTLRLLTTQQFLRANKVICALELIRRKKPEKYGREAFTSGLWVGSASSPNTFYQVKETIEKEQYSKLILTLCPWCNKALKSENYHVKENSFHLTCTNQTCDFGKANNNVLPCNIVDESLYQSPPSLLLATVDKFARLAWEERAGVFFGGHRNRPPELIIQDELHLISSALGSIVGLYEAGIDTALIARGMRSKYIASTATIKHASKQVKALFGRVMQVFPPSGLRYDDSYFAKTVPVEKKSGRIYVGYLAPLLSPSNCMAPLASALLAAPIGLFSDDEAFMDHWWTQIVYHSSLKGLSNSRTLYQNQVETGLIKRVFQYLKDQIESEYPGFTNDHKLENIQDFEKIKEPEIQQIIKKYLPIRETTVKALTSNQSAEENAEVFSRLAKGKHESGVIDVALATNMISVGLDVSRLALMIINGQPLTTAEYIQASSRVGRGSIPGIIYINFYKSQARSLSHYENFRSYHDAFYRYVEPSSLTPFTYQARQRALHASLVIALRHAGIGLLPNKSAEDFDKQKEDIKKVVSELKLRCKSAIEDEQEYEATVQNINALIMEWQDHVVYCDEQKMNLVYHSDDQSSANLLCSFDHRNGLWKTLNSMRNVEKTALIKLFPGIRNHHE